MADKSVFKADIDLSFNNGTTIKDTSTDIVLNNNTEFYQWMTDEEDRQMMENSAKKEGIKEGIDKGIHKNQKEIIKNMKKENISIETIKKVTGLSIEQINEIS